MCICFDIVKDRYFDWFVCLYYLLIYYFIDFWICMCAHFYVHAMCMILYVYVQKDAKSISRDWFYIYIISLSIRNGPPRRNSSFTSNECSFTPTVVLYQCKSIDYMHMMSHFMCRRRFHKLNWIRLEGLPHWGCPPQKKKTSCHKPRVNYLSSAVPKTEIASTVISGDGDRSQAFCPLSILMCMNCFHRLCTSGERLSSEKDAQGRKWYRRAKERRMFLLSRYPLWIGLVHPLCDV